MIAPGSDLALLLLAAANVLPPFTPLGISRFGSWASIQQEILMNVTSQTEPLAVIRRLLAALNAHDIDAFVDCFAEEYQSEQPVHPARQFSGFAQVRQNWSRMFEGVPDIKGELIGYAVAGQQVWAEMRWHGTHLDGSGFDMRGVVIMEIRAGRIVSGRLFMEPVREADPGINEAVGELSKAPE